MPRIFDNIDNSEVIHYKKQIAQEFCEQLTLGAPTNEDEVGLRRRGGFGENSDCLDFSQDFRIGFFLRNSYYLPQKFSNYVGRLCSSLWIAG